MPDSVPAAAAAQLDDPFAELRGPLAGTVRMRLEVTGNVQLTPHMQRLVLTAPELEDLTYRPGQDVMLLVAVDGNRPVRRRYTIRDLGTTRRLLTLDIVRHGDGPGEQWVRSAQPGDTIEGIAPRGKVFVDSQADWHLFAADESGLAAVFAMTGSLPASSRAAAFLEVPEAADEQKPDLPVGVSLTWLPRDGHPAGGTEALAAALREAELPAGAGHFYLFGEARTVLTLRETLAARGVPGEQVSAKAYWGRGKANAQHGEPARDS
ncbi:MAG: siderophore-interacting protein [Streptosporangiaceae bacterium]